MNGTIAYQAIEKNRAMLEGIAKKMWEKPEGPYREFNACEWISTALKEAGFAVEIGAGGVPTAIKATWGSGHPVIGILGELDALPGMSQKLVTHKEAAVPGDYGQGCGHNLLGVGALGGALGLKAEMEERKLPGTVVYYGCPAEEVLTGKSFMARGHAFDGLDLCVDFHPGTTNAVRTGKNTALNSAIFHFKGRTAHAGGDPHNGRSALDAVELMNVGANYLREHVTSDVRIHYIILEGGTAPNIVPDVASSKYFVRALTRDAVVDVYDRLVKVAKGAAMMTETELEIEFLGGCYNRLCNMELSKVLYDCLAEAPKEAFTEEEKAFAHALNQTMPELYEQLRTKAYAPEGTDLHEGLLPIEPVDGYGSSDVGDVQHIVPGASFSTACFAIGAPGHSWQNSACSGHSLGLRGMIYASRVLALFGLKVLENPDILKKAKEEFDKETGGKPYICPIPEELPIP